MGNISRRNWKNCRFQVCRLVETLKCFFKPWLLVIWQVKQGRGLAEARPLKISEGWKETVVVRNRQIPRKGPWHQQWLSTAGALKPTPSEQKTPKCTYDWQTVAPPVRGCWPDGHRVADTPSPQRPRCDGVWSTYSSETETSANQIHKPQCLERGKNNVTDLQSIPKIDTRTDSSHSSQRNSPVYNCMYTALWHSSSVYNSVWNMGL